MAKRGRFRIFLSVVQDVRLYSSAPCTNTPLAALCALQSCVAAPSFRSLSEKGRAGLGGMLPGDATLSPFFVSNLFHSWPCSCVPSCALKHAATFASPWSPLAQVMEDPALKAAREDVLLHSLDVPPAPEEAYASRMAELIALGADPRPPPANQPTWRPLASQELTELRALLRAATPTAECRAGLVLLCRAVPPHAWPTVGQPRRVTRPTPPALSSARCL